MRVKDKKMPLSYWNWRLNNKRGVLNRCKKPWVCNVFVTTSRVTPWFSAIFGYPNDNRTIIYESERNKALYDLPEYLFWEVFVYTPGTAVLHCVISAVFSIIFSQRTSCASIHPIILSSALEIAEIPAVGVCKLKPVNWRIWAGVCKSESASRKRVDFCFFDALLL